MEVNEKELSNKIFNFFSDIIYQIVSIADGDIIVKHPEYEKYSLEVYTEPEELSSFFEHLLDLENRKTKAFKPFLFYYSKVNEIFEVYVILSEKSDDNDICLIVEPKKTDLKEIPENYVSLQVKSR